MTVQSFITNARKLIGKSYEECDCIGVVRKSLSISCQGTNWLWRSINNSSKYRYLVERHQAGYNQFISPGCVVFKISSKVPAGYDDPPDCHHVGVYTGKTVIHSSPNIGVREEKFNDGDWQGMGWMKQVDREEQPDNPSRDPLTREELTDHEMITAIYNAIMKN